MGVLTEDLTRLRNEILALRDARQALINDLERETADRRTDISHMRTDFSKRLGAVAGRTKADRLGSIADLKRTVSDLRAGIRTDLSGLRHTWLALGAPSRRVTEELENHARREARANAQERPGDRVSKRSPKFVGGEKPARRKRKR